LVDSFEFELTPLFAILYPSRENVCLIQQDTATTHTARHFKQLLCMWWGG